MLQLISVFHRGKIKIQHASLLNGLFLADILDVSELPSAIQIDIIDQEI